MRTLTAVEKWSYAVGNMPFSVKDAAFVNFVVFYYTQVQGLSGSLAGLAMFIAMVSDAINDPIVGSWSDTFKSRWGRRHPLILGGGLPMALMFLALFAPPDGMGEIGIFLWLTIVSILLRTFLTIYFIPYSAMGAELSGDYDERTVIAKARVTNVHAKERNQCILGDKRTTITNLSSRRPQETRLPEKSYFKGGDLYERPAIVTSPIGCWHVRFPGACVVEIRQKTRLRE